MDLKQFRVLLSRTIVLPIIVAAVLSAVLLAVVLSLMNAFRWVDHTDQVIAQSNRLLSLIVDMETGFRGYVSSADQTFLQPYHRAETQLPSHFDTLAQLVSDNSRQTDRLKQIRASYETWKQYAGGLIDLRQRDQNGAQNEYVSLHGKKLMDQIRMQVAEFTQTEEELRSARVSRARRTSQFAIAATLVLTVFFGIIVAFFTRGSMLTLSNRFQAALDEAHQQSDALRMSERRWITTLSSIGDAVIATDPSGRITFMNTIAENLTGYSLREAAGRDLVEVFNIVNETSRARHEDPVAKIKRLRAVVGLANHTVLLGKQGTEIPIDDSGAPIIDDDGQMTGIILVFRDIRERKRAESALRAADRLAATGKLAASLAHEIHNPLANVGSLLYLMGRVELPPQVKDYLRQAAEELKRITNLSHRMLSLNRESQSPVPVKIVDLLDSIIESLRWRIQQGTVDLKRHYEFQGEIAGFPGELRQVFFNLIMNALEAMDGRGTLEIRARSSPDPRYAVEVAIRDSGVGIPNSARPNVFQSFFTTKGEKGTGLGLWIARNIVQKHNGSITFDTRTDGSDQGTEFTVTLPRQPAA